jgi:uncharacterized small protein (DUF1192 family)
MNAEDKRVQRLALLEDHIGRHLAEAAASGELQAAPSYGKPLDFGDGYDETPAELRMAMKVLKDAGVVPPEVELMQQIAALQAELAMLTDVEAVQAMRQRIAERQQVLALRLERLRLNPSL